MRMFDPDRSWALLVGTAEHAELAPLPEVRANLAALAGALDFRPDHVRVVADPADPALIGAALTEIGARAEDLLLVYFAGHGLLDRRGRLHLGLTGTRDDPGLLAYSALPYEVVRESVAASAAACRLVVLDCCFSGRAIDAAGAPSSVVAGQVEIQGACTLTSSSRVSVSVARSGGRYTAFTGELLGVLRDGIPDGPATLGLNDIFYELRTRLVRRGMPEPRIAVHQDIALLGIARNRAVDPPAVVEEAPAERRDNSRARSIGVTLGIGAAGVFLTLLSTFIPGNDLTLVPGAQPKPSPVASSAAAAPSGEKPRPPVLPSSAPSVQSEPSKRLMTTSPVASTTPPAPSGDVQIPADLVGRPRQEAAKTLVALGLSWHATYLESEEFSGRVMDVRPPGGTTVGPGTDVELYVGERRESPAPAAAVAERLDDLVGLGREGLQNWLAGKPAYRVEYKGDCQSDCFLVVQQSPGPCQPFDPATQTLEITLGGSARIPAGHTPRPCPD